MASIVVAGDLLWDFNVVQLPSAPASHHEAVPHALMGWQPGGAWFLGGLVARACGDLGPAIDVVCTPPLLDPTLDDPELAGQAFSVWTLHERCTDDRCHKDRRAKAWRIDRLLGCRAAPSEAPPRLPESAVADPDVLVLDDLNLGFRERRDTWPHALRDGGNPKHIVLKTCAPLGEGELWGWLVPRFADRMTVVLSATALRRQRAPISQCLSWDLTIEDLTAELTSGPSAYDLGQCRRVVVQLAAEGVASFSRCRPLLGPPLARQAELGDSPVRLERVLYHPSELEGAWQSKHPGTISGSTSILTAAIVRHETDATTYPLFIALGRGLCALRANHEVGGGHERSGPNFDAATTSIDSTFVAPFTAAMSRNEPAQIFRTAFPHDVLDHPSMRAQEASRSDLLRDVTGAGQEYVFAKAIDVVLRGFAALDGAPRAEFGRYFTVDREEIERINGIRQMMQSYRDNPADVRPLSIAVFGQPGTGKSFAIKELATEVLGGRQPLQFNLSQFGDAPAELHHAFHQVRDASVRGELPVVFWDEFDSGELAWLEAFLAPMQDAEFREGSITHRFGRAIFVFAGGTCHDMAQFLAKMADANFVARKGPDFVSRLRGYVNIKGPNPLPRSGTLTDAPNEAPPWRDAAIRDPAYLIRRAVILRGALERVAKHLVDEDSGRATVNASVLRGFLRVHQYRHGARSLEAVLTMSRLAGKRFFAAADLPRPELLRLHVTDDFLDEVRQGELESPAVEALAEACHEAWRTERESKDWTYATERDDDKKTHPLLVPYDRLGESDKESNRLTARLTQAKLRDLGLCIAPFAGQETPPVELTGAETDALMRMEHDIWLRDRLLQGWDWAQRTDEPRRLHADVARFDDLSDDDKALDRAIARSIVPALTRARYVLCRVRLVIGVVGHRCIGDRAPITAGVEDAIERIAGAFPERLLTVCSALAEGSDRLAASCVLARPESHLEVVLPLPRDEYLTDFETVESRREFLDLLGRAERPVTEVPPQATRRDAYRAAGSCIVDRADVILALWDGDESSVTGELVREARRRRLPLAWVHVANQEPHAEKPVEKNANPARVTVENF